MRIPTKEEFEAMLPPQKRVAIAQDCLLQLSIAESLMSKGIGNGGYLNINVEDDGPALEGMQLKELFDKPQCIKDCTCCAKGALMLAKIMRYNEFKIEQIHISDDPEYANVEMDDDDTSKALAGIFDQDQLDLIENVFEQWSITNDDGEEVYAPDFKNLGDHDLMVKICENIVENNGTFEPNLVLVEA